MCFGWSLIIGGRNLNFAIFHFGDVYVYLVSGTSIWMMEKVYSEMAKTRLIGIREYVNSIRVNEALRAVL